MKIIYSPLHREHRPSAEYINLQKIPAVEIPERIEAIMSELRRNGLDSLIQEPETFPRTFIEKMHHKNYIDYLKNTAASLSSNDAYFPSYYIMDTYTPIVSATYDAAVSAVDCALTGAKMLENENEVYALCRPPGHHAEESVMGGYCYFNNAAIAADYLSQKGKVAILDIDYHHGNGTQRIFYDRADVNYISLHADPTDIFPFISGFREEQGRGTGAGYNHNFPLPPKTDNAAYLTILKKALQVIAEYKPQTLVVSCGFDTYEKDPLGNFALTIPFYETIAKEIRSLQLPTLVIQEGGYHVGDLGKIAHSFYKGLV